MIFRRRKPQGGGAERPHMDKLDRPSGPSLRPVRPLVQPTAAEGLDGSREAGARAVQPLLRAEPPRRAAGVSLATERGEKSGPSESRKLTAGREITLNGQISACDRLIVEGRVDADLDNCRTIEVLEGGSFKGTAMVETALISGRFDGVLTVRGLLAIHRTGQVDGAVRYGSLEVQAGGAIDGDVKSLAGEGLTAPAPDARSLTGRTGEAPALRSVGED